MSTTLFELDDFTETRTEWEPIYGRGMVCRDCGTKRVSGTGGGTPGLGQYEVCDECAAIDECRIREHEVVIERRASSFLTVDELAHCAFCHWFVSVHEWADGTATDVTPERLAELAAEHVRPVHTSHWGKSHEITEHDGLVAARAHRRAAYLAREAVTA